MLMLGIVTAIMMFLAEESDEGESSLTQTAKIIVWFPYC